MILPDNYDLIFAKSLESENLAETIESGPLCITDVFQNQSVVESVQDFLIKLDIKPPMHLLEISTFSLNNVIVRLTKIMNRADKNWAHF